MGQRGNGSYDDQINDISRRDNGLSSLYHEEHTSRIDPRQPEQQEEQPSSGSEAPAYQNHVSSLSRAHSRNSASTRRSEGYNRRHRSPLNSGIWISVEFIVTMGQIVAAIVVLSLSRHENPEAPLFAWVVGYTSGCVATLPVLYWRYYKFSQSTEQDANQSHHGVSQSSTSYEPSAHMAISVASAPTDENQHRIISASTNNQTTGSLTMHLNGLVNYFKVALDCFFAVWFVVGNVWIFGDHSSPTDAPKLYRLCLVFLIFSFVGYAMPFILCATVCCCLPCIISALGVREDLSQTRGATLESINALPTYKFKLRGSGKHQDVNSGPAEGGVLAAGTEKELEISGEAAVCCICLAKYADDDELKELPCLHFFHVECIDKWLKINASCPLCKFEIGVRDGASSSTINSNPHDS